jgi:hypothetical protein
MLLTVICSSSAQAEELTVAAGQVVTMSCNGTRKTMTDGNWGEPEPISELGVVVNVAEGTVSFTGYVAHIESDDAAAVISFESEDPSILAAGDIDRGTGEMTAVTGRGVIVIYYELVCKGMHG